MNSISIRLLKPFEFQAARELTAAFPDRHAQYVVERLPRFFSIAHFFDPPRIYAARQKLVLGAYDARLLVGTIAAESAGVHQASDLNEGQWGEFFSRFSQRDLDVYTELNAALLRTYIGAPSGSLIVHSLSVSPEYRRRGIGKLLAKNLLCNLDAEDRQSLYVEIARSAKLKRFFESIGFRMIKKTFSISERLEFGCWGSILLKYSSKE